ncbi:Integrase core domain [Bordetella ansorpii]|uniref:Integrase core domain n=1 Tax=Bordetella ansorpii TaxID=288768 RepID=A0A157SVX4_9BORD|nr:DDE-type integrase/transposase/recombinase [Bordetella ansorpii]SAI74589.1 Integrase core domain [Bordetella ansorpii]
MALTHDALDYLRGVAVQLDQLGAKSGRRAVVESAAAFLGWSPQTVYRQLQQRCGWSSGRKARADKGRTSVADDALKMLGAAQRESIRDNGKQTLFTTTARGVLARNGVEFNVSNAQLNRLMRDRRLNVDAQRDGTSVQHMRALHPNHVHQIDPSLCLVYYLKGKQHIMREREFYKNKLENYARVKLKVYRYVLYDRASGLIVPWYTEAEGEDTHSLFEFLMFAWSRRDGRQFHGVPRLVLWDKGSANRAGTILNLLDRLDVRYETHEAGHARVKGGVEGANNIVETQFESRLRFEPVEDVVQLNQAAFAWANAYNANLLPGQDTRLRREGLAVPMARLDLWQLITAEQLRELPSIEICRALMASRSEERKVRPDMSISFRHPNADRSRSYSLRGLAGVNRGELVSVQALAYGETAIQVSVPRYDGEMLVYRVEPEHEFDQFGERLSAAVIGEEYKAMPHTDIERAAQQLDATAYPGLDADGVKKARARKAVPFGGTLDAHSYIQGIEQPAYLPRTGEAIATPAHVEEVIPVLSAEAAMLRLVDAIKRSLTSDEHAWFRRLYADGVREDRVDALIEEFKRRGQPDASFGLRIA